MPVRRPSVCCTDVLALLAFAVAFATPASAQGTDELWEISSRMDMPGMPMAMPAQTNRVCLGKNRKDEDLVPRQGDCRVVDSRRSGNQLNYKMECAGPEPSTVDGTITFGDGAYTGKMRMTMTRTKDAVDLALAGKRVGACTATK